MLSEMPLHVPEAEVEVYSELYLVADFERACRSIGHVPYVGFEALIEGMRHFENAFVRCDRPYIRWLAATLWEEDG